MSNVVPISDMVAETLARSAAMNEELPLKGGGGGGTSGGMDVFDAKIAASEARTDTKFAELRSDLKEFATAKEMRGTVWGAAFTLGAIILGAIAFGGDRFDAGIGMSDVRQAQAERDKKQDESVRGITKQLDELIAAQRKNST